MSVSVFLSGAMDYVGEYATSWRKEATFLLTQRGYRVFDPTSIPEDVSMSSEEIAQKNLFMQRKSDLLLVEYMLEDRAYIGTDFELAWAKIHSQPSVVMCNPIHIDRVYMQYMATKLVGNLQDAIDYIAVHYPTK
jgi:hypothetical protein